MSFRKAGFFAKTLEFSLINNDYAFSVLKRWLNLLFMCGPKVHFFIFTIFYWNGVIKGSLAL